MKKIKLTQGKYALVDDADYKNLNQFKWCAHKERNIWYARRNEENKTISMHRYILKTPNGLETDHIDGNGLNNQRFNLRVCSTSQNSKNRKINKNNISGFKGVCWNKISKKWQAYIKVDYKRIHLGLFPSKIKAYEAYCLASVKFHGKFSRKR